MLVQKDAWEWTRHIFTEWKLAVLWKGAGLIAYNVYRCFPYEDASYPFFRRILPHFWDSPLTPNHRIDGLWIFPAASPLIAFAGQIRKEEAGA
ncbi:MAG: hypothetical protein L0Y72_07135 [Gemmataceae bacterium]|nr:hypothetical protein [Gemmataceae bacterium]MCI0738800.1 hypothetical protein [Gemmataceae bacterium]